MLNKIDWIKIKEQLYDVLIDFDIARWLIILIL